MDTPSRRAVSLRGLGAGALGGTLAALLDYGFCHDLALRFLPQSTIRLLLFLVTLDAAVGALAGLGVALLLRLLGTTDLRVLAAPPEAPAPAAAPRAAYFVATLFTLVLYGGVLHVVVRQALIRFHAHLPIAALVALVATGLVVPLVAVVFLLARLLALLWRSARPGATLRLTSPRSWVLGWAVAGLGLVAAGALVYVDQLQLRPRMTPAMRALNAALWIPPLAVVVLLVAAILAHYSWRVAARISWVRAQAVRLDQLRIAVLGIVVLGISAAAVALAVLWPVAKLVQWQPLALVTVAVAAAALIAAWWPARQRCSFYFRVSLIPLVPLLLLGGAWVCGRPDRVRKAASTSQLGPPLLLALHQLTDWDQDGHSSALGFGGDCNDRDPAIHPGAFDWPDDGIDQNCNGHQATLEAPPPVSPVPLPAAVPARPNVVLITIDALRADHVSAYGYPRPTTPALDALAHDAVLFRNSWAHSPSTRYSVPAILIGRYASAIAWDAQAHWPPLVLPENRLLAEMFKAQGYHTAALVPAHYFEPGWGLTQGFDDYDNSLARLHANPFGGDPARTTGSSSRELADLALAWLDKNAAAATPFFLWLHFYDPHYLYEHHPEVTDFGASDVDRYDNEVRFTDLHIGRVLDGLRSRGLWERTAVIVTADHGEGFGEHGVKQHGYHIYVQQNRVPLLIRVPGITARSVDEPVGHVDLFPTVVDLIRAPATPDDAPQLLGRSLLGLMLGQHEPGRLVFGEVEYEGPVIRKAVASREQHLIYNVVPDNTFERYDLVQDPAEAHDIYQGTHSGVEGALEQALGAWMDQEALPRDFRERVTANLANHPFPVATPLSAVLGDMLVIDGITAPDPAQKIVPGKPVRLDVMLHVARPIPPGWRLFTHVFGPGGRFLNADHEPLSGYLPLARLRPGQYVRDRLSLVLPAGWPAGRLTVRYGLWRGAERARVADGSDHVVVATLEVTP